ncbi:MAG: hypothetical protein J0M36_13020 [Caulobacterales bacterium]|nr:hypothetical protein [Caulobacterales bacterium]
MSCGLALAAALMLSNPDVAAAAAAPPPPADAPVSVASEPLFADIVARSTRLKALVDGWNGIMPAADAFAAFRTETEALAALDMQGHLILKQRGTDGDLKCILRGISEDMAKKVEAVTAAASPREQAVALSELAYLLNDNVEVITAPPQPAV